MYFSAHSRACRSQPSRECHIRSQHRKAKSRNLRLLALASTKRSIFSTSPSSSHSDSVMWSSSFALRACDVSFAIDPYIRIAAAMAELSHFDDKGASRMVDTSGKAETERVARASGVVRMSPATAALIRDKKLSKGDVLEVARLAGIMAA